MWQGSHYISLSRRVRAGYLLSVYFFSTQGHKHNFYLSCMGELEHIFSSTLSIGFPHGTGSLYLYLLCLRTEFVAIMSTSIYQ